MKKFILLLIVVFITGLVQADNKEKDIKSQIDKVTVFTNHAQITRVAETTFQKGSYLLRFTDLSPNINSNSVRIKGSGDLMVMSVRFKHNEAKKKEYPQKIRLIENRIKEVKEKIETENMWIQYLSEDENYLKKNTTMVNPQELASPESIKNMHNYFQKKLESIRLQKLKKSRMIEELNDSVQNMQNRINALNNVKEDPSGEILIEIDVRQYTKAEFELSYLVSNAGWYAGYDLRIENINEPVQLTYKAYIFQNTGISWNNVNLKLSNADVRKSGRMPKLKPYYIYTGGRTTQQSGQRFQNPNRPYNQAIRHVSGYVRDASTGETLPGVNIRTNAGNTTTSDVNGFYSIDIPDRARYLYYNYVGYQNLNQNVSSSQMNVFLNPSHQSLEAMSISSSRRIDAVQMTPPNKAANYTKGQTKAKDVQISQPQATISQPVANVEYKLEGRHNIENSGKARAVAFRTKNVPSIYEYQCIPKLHEYAFLFARISGWEDLNLVTGKANVYFENTYVGETTINVNQMKDTLMLSLGEDQNIIVSRIKLKDFSKKQSFTNNFKVSRKYQINLQNNKKSKIKLKVYDQVPVSQVKDVEIDIDELSNGTLNPNNGFVEWQMELDGKSKKELEIGYTIKYPKSLNLHIP